MTISKEKDQLIKENCENCKEKCDYGIVETDELVRCVDKNITISKKK